MQRPKFINKTRISQNNTYEALPLEEKLRRKMEGVNEEGTEINEMIPILYTDRKAGVMPETDIRTDRFEVAREAMEKIQIAKAQKAAKSEGQEKEKSETPTEEQSNA